MGYFGGGGGGGISPPGGGLTPPRVPFASGGSALADDADMTFATDTLTVTKIQPTSIELGNASDTTLTRSGAGTVNIEASRIMTVGTENSGQLVACAYIWGSNQTWNNDFSTNWGGDTGRRYATVQTPDALQDRVGATSMSVVIVANADNNTDQKNGPAGTSACTHPTVIVNPLGGNGTQYLGIAYYGLAGRAVKSLTAASPTSVVRIPIAAGAGTGGVLHYTVFASDATDHQSRSGSVHFMAVNKAGTETGAIYGIDTLFTVNPNQTQDGSGAGAISSGTLTYTWGVSTAPTNAIDLTLNAASSLTETTLDIYYRVDMTGPGEPVPQ